MGNCSESYPQKYITHAILQTLIYTKILFSLSKLNLLTNIKVKFGGAGVAQWQSVIS